MLVAALVVTLVGFGLLVIALITSSVAFAWACVVVCLVGFGLLIADVLGLRRGDAESSAPAAEHAETEPSGDEAAAHAAHGETEQGEE